MSGCRGRARIAARRTAGDGCLSPLRTAASRMPRRRGPGAPSPCNAQIAWTPAAFRPVELTGPSIRSASSRATTVSPRSTSSLGRAAARTCCRSSAPRRAPSGRPWTASADRSASALRHDPIDPPVRLVAQGVSCAEPLPVLYPLGVGLCCTMKLYQSIIQTCPSGPTSARIGEVHSSSLADEVPGVVRVEIGAVRVEREVATRCPVGSATNAVLFQ